MGKYSKLRACPVLDQEISTVECGEWRNQSIQCVPECTYNPLSKANYDKLREVEDEVDRKSIEFIAQNLSAKEGATFKGLFKNARTYDPSALLAWKLFYERDDLQGKSRFELWRQSGWQGLKNDEIVVLQQSTQSRVALLEVQSLLDETFFEAIDLLGEEPGRRLTIADRGLVRQLVRFETILVMLRPVQDFWRMERFSIRMEDFSPLAPRSVVEGIISHLNGPSDPADYTAWLLEHFKEFVHALVAGVKARKEATLKPLDRDIYVIKFQIQGEVKPLFDILERHPDVAEEECSETEKEGKGESWVWLKPALKERSCVRYVAGRMVIHDEFWTLEVPGKQNADELCQKIEHVFKHALVRVDETIQPFKTQEDDAKPTPSEEVVPPFMLENLQPVALQSMRILPEWIPDGDGDLESRILVEQYREFLESPNPLLNGRTPKQAAQDPGSHESLIRLMKVQISGHEKRNKARGRSDDFNWVLEELGLDELKSE